MEKLPKNTARESFELLANDLIQDIHVLLLAGFLLWERFSNPAFPEVRLKSLKDRYGTFDINESVETWNHWSTDNCWALSENEIRHIQNYFTQPKLQQQRTSLGLPNNPTDVEN